jgi:Repeat of unknown function (DUF346)
MPSKKKSPTNSEGASARRRQRSMPGEGIAETPVAPGMSGEEEMPGSDAIDVEPTTEMVGEMGSASAAAAMTGGDMPSGAMGSTGEGSGDVDVTRPEEEFEPAEAGAEVKVGAVAAPRAIVPPADFEAAGLAPVITAAPSLTNHGGPILGAVQVVPMYWGAAWATAANSQLATQLDSFFDVVLTSEYMDMLAEYSTTTTTIQHGQRLASVRIANSEPGAIVGGVRQVTDGQIQTSLQGFIANGTVPATTANTLYFIFLPPGVVSILGSSQSCSAFCGYHNHIGGVRYSVIPFADCAGCVFPGQFLDTLTEVASHELAEAITDPDLNAWWDGGTGDEIGDICNRQTTHLGGFMVQTEWSNGQNACVVAPAAPAGAPRPSSSPVVSWAANRLDVFVLGTDRALYHKWWNGSAWGPSLTGYEGMGGICESAPQAVAWGPNRLDVFVTGTNSALYHKWWNGSAWGPSLTGYEGMGGICESAPQAVAWGPNRLDVFVMGTNSALYHKWWNGSAWGPSVTGYEFMGGICVGDPRVVSWGPNRLDVFVLGTDRALYHKWWNGSAWGPSVTGYEGQGGVIVGQAEVVSWGPNRLDVFVLGTDRALYHKWWDGSSWGPSLTGYERLGGICMSAPRAVAWGPNRLDVFVVGTDGALYHKWWNGSSWGPSLTGFERQGGVCVGQVEAVAWGPNRLDVFVIGTDSALYHKWWNGSAWGPSLTGYEPMGGICTSQPRVAAWAPNRLDVFVTGTDSALYHKWWNGSAWGPSVTGYERQGGVISSF